MPTGYTAPVVDGEITELSDFVLNCARGFGSLVLLRDSDQSLEATRRYVAEGTYLESTSYEEGSLAKAYTRLAELQAMTDEQALAAAQAEADEVVASNARRLENVRLKRARYERMIAKVEGWEPPTPDHVAFKEWMLSQLRESVDFDCTPYGFTVPEVSLAWRDDQINRTLKQIQDAKKRIEEARERNENRKAWVEALLDSLEEHAHAGAAS